jgi:hypothetical protein
MLNDWGRRHKCIKPTFPEHFDLGRSAQHRDSTSTSRAKSLFFPIFSMYAAFSILLFSAVALGVPSGHHFSPRQNTTTGPCDPWANACQPVRVANACLAQFLNRASDAQILMCVNDQDAAQAKIDVSERMA